MSNKQITLRRGKEESLARRHPWIFSGAVAQLPDGLDEGDTVQVTNSEGHYLATGHWQHGSIAVRVLSWQDEAIDRNFWAARLGAALGLRRTLGLTDAYRLVHGEGDNLPGLIVDVYGRTAVMQAHSVGMHRNRQVIADALVQVMGGDIDSVYYKSETTLTHQGTNEFLVGGGGSDIAVENGLRFHIDWLRGQKTGFFIDQRDNRALVERYSAGRNVLNMFCYTGGFSVYAMRGGAAKVHSVDSSQKAIDLVNSNIQLNFPDDARHQAYASDAFRFLDQMGQEDYDLVILDPPAFAKHLSAQRQALRGYTKLNARAMQKIAPGGILFTFSCSQAISREQFRLAVFTAAAQAGRKARILHQLTQGTDHPVNIYHPEGEYLKGLVLYIE